MPKSLVRAEPGSQELALQACMKWRRDHRCNFESLLFSEWMRFALLVYFCAAVTALHAERPFDFASTPGKLPKQVRPTDYAIWIKPDIKKLTFMGRETVKLKVEQATSQLVLNAADLTVSDAQLDGKTIPKTKFDPKNELLTITAPGPTAM